MKVNVTFHFRKKFGGEGEEAQKAKYQNKVQCKVFRVSDDAMSSADVGTVHCVL